MNNKSAECSSQSLKNLLTGAFGDEAEAVESYKLWREQTDFENISPAEYGLLPQVYENLQRRKFEDDLTPKIKGICRRIWLENQIYKKEIIKFFEILESFETDFILLTREPLTNCLDKKSEKNFVTENFRILINFQITQEIFTELERKGWRCGEKYQEKSLDSKEIWFKHKPHFNIIVESKSLIFGRDVWKFAEIIKFGGKEIKILNSTDYLLHILSDEFLTLQKKNTKNWVLLATLTLQNNAQIDWERLSQQCQKLKLNFSMAEMLDEASNFKNFPNYARARYKFFAAPGKLRRVFSAYRSLKKSYKKTSGKFSIIGFARFLQQHWKVDSFSQLPKQIGRKLLKY